MIVRHIIHTEKIHAFPTAQYQESFLTLSHTADLLGMVAPRSRAVHARASVRILPYLDGC